MSEREEFTKKLTSYFYDLLRKANCPSEDASLYAHHATKIHSHYYWDRGDTHETALQHARNSIKKHLRPAKHSVHPGGSLYQEEVAKQRETQEALVDVRSPTRGTSSHPSTFHYAAATADEDIQGL